MQVTDESIINWIIIKIGIKKPLNVTWIAEFLLLVLFSQISIALCSANPYWCFVGTCKYVNTLTKETIQSISTVCFETHKMYVP